MHQQVREHNISRWAGLLLDELSRISDRSTGGRRPGPEAEYVTAGRARAPSAGKKTCRRVGPTAATAATAAG